MAEAVIIAGKLSDAELKDSIQRLISYVDSSTKQMAASFDSSIKEMAQSLKQLNGEGGNFRNKASENRIKTNREETNSVKEISQSYDQLASATQKAVQPTRSAQDSFYVFIQHYREQAANLAREINNLPGQSLDRQYAEYQKFENQIIAVQKQIQELRNQLNEVGKNPNASRFETKAIVDEINRLQEKIKSLTFEQITSTRRISEADKRAIEDKQLQLNGVKNTIRSLTSEEVRRSDITRSTEAAQQQAAQAAQIRTQEEQRAAQQAIQSEERRREEIIKTGMAAQELSGQIIKTMHFQLGKEGNDPVLGLKELYSALRQMREAYFSMPNEQRQSPIGKALEEDIKRAEKALVIVQKYNQSLMSNMQSDYSQHNYERLKGILKQLTDEYHNLSRAEMQATKGREIANSIQMVNREMQKIQNSMNRPFDLQKVLGLSEKTLDDIAYKMQTLSRYRSGVDLTKQGSANEIKQINQEYERLLKRQNELINQNSRYVHSNTALGRSFDYIKNRLAFMLTIGAATQFTKTVYEIRGQYELLERSIGILFDSMQQGSQIFAELNAMAIKSPFTTMELGAAAKQLAAYDIAAKNVVDTTKRLADMAAAVGVPIERLTYALGQVKAYGYLNARDARMFANAGIPLVKELADRYTELEGRLVSVGDVYDRIKKKAISFEDVMDIINKVTDEGGKFFNFQEKAANTLKVKLANLTLSYNNMLNELGKSQQKLLTLPLTTLKTVFEHWRQLNNIILTVVTTYGILKAAQLIAIRTGMVQVSANTALAKQYVTLKNSALGAGKAIASVASSGWNWATLAVGALTYLIMAYVDLKKANDSFNKSIATNAKENIDSINKFFEEYQKKIESIGTLSILEQQKMWERLQEEIEKTTKNAKGYLDILNNISSVSGRVRAGKEVLDQIKEIEKEAQRLAEHNMFDIGGGFANTSLAKDLKQYEKQLNSLTNNYGSIEKAEEHFRGKTVSGGMFDSRLNQLGYYKKELREAKAELQDFVSVLDKANIGEIMGVGDTETKFANIREFASIIRDNFLATEEGQKIGSEGRALLNKQLDEWISKQGVANELINNERATIEENRTAWEAFFDQLNEKDKERLDYLIETNQTGSEDFKKIWDKATKGMAESAKTSYDQIQDQIANLRNTPDIVIRVVYRQETEQLDKQQEEFKKRFLTPKGLGALSADAYFSKRQELNEKYGRFQKKADEDNVEWEKRLGEQYRDTSDKIGKLNKQLASNNKLSKVNRDAKKEELEALTKEKKALEEIRKEQGFDYSKKDKKSKTNKKDYLGEALAKEVQVIDEIQKRFKEYKYLGVDAQTAIEKATEEYGNTLIRNNAILEKFGVPTISSEQIAKMPLQEIRDFYNEQLKVANQLNNTKGIEALEKILAKINVEITKIDYKKITDGLNNELSKLKDDYELAVELDANPELGDMFADVFAIDTSVLPHSFAEAYDMANDIARKKLEELKVDVKGFDLMSTMIQGGEDGKWKNLEIDSKVVQDLLKWQNTFRDMFKKNMEETEKMLDDYVKKYGDYSDKVAEIEADRLGKIKKLNEAYYSREMREKPEYYAKLNAIEQGAQREKGKAMFDEFKNSQLYITMFENLEYASTASLEAIRSKLEELKKEMGTLSPEQLKQVTQQFEKIDKELISRNPFKGLIKSVKDYSKAIGKQGKQAQIDFKNAQDNYDAQLKVVAALKERLENEKRNTDVNKETLLALQSQIIYEDEKLRKLKEELDAAEALNEQYNLMRQIFGEQAQAIAKLVQTVSANLQSLSELRDILHQMFGVDLGNELNAVIDDLNTVGEGLNQVTSSAQSGNVVGVVTGTIKTVAGIGDAVASIFGDGAARTKRINKEIDRSKESVRQLNLAYQDLERVVEKSLGTTETEARRAAIANKEAELAEIERQLVLEQSKRSKDRDKDTIKSLQETIIGLRHEIEDLKEDVVNNLWGSDVKSAAEAFVDAWVEAWKAGETTLDAMQQKMNDMIANLVKKAMTSKIVESLLKPLYDQLDFYTKESSAGGVALTMDELRMLAQHAGIVAEDINVALGEFYGNLANLDIFKPTEQSQELSALQQGISQITEPTAEAITAYLNGISQQVYLHSDLLVQIRDAIIGSNSDAQLGVQAQMLLQLQQSYQTQQAIQQILEGVLVPSGRAFAVELVS